MDDDPFFALPEHFLIPVDKEGNGPINDLADYDHEGCFCGDLTCEEWKP